jgi:hypothetical protein
MDWLVVSIIASIAIFFASVSLVLIKVVHTKPYLIRHASPSGLDTTYNWNTILGIFGSCTGLAGGVFVISNALVFIGTGQWQIDPRSLGLLVVAFAILLLQSFDRFVTRLLR